MTQDKNMTPVEFCTWLEGFLHKSNDADAKLIKDKLKSVDRTVTVTPNSVGPVTIPPGYPIWRTVPPYVIPPYTVGDDPNYKGPTC